MPWKRWALLASIGLLVAGVPATAATRTALGFYNSRETLDAAPVEGPDGNCYAATTSSGENQFGSILRITPAGAVSTIHSFAGGASGDGPVGGLVAGSNGKLYGVTARGGVGRGTLFCISITGVFEQLAVFGAGDTEFTFIGKLIVRSDGSVFGLRTSVLPSGSLNFSEIFKYTPSAGLKTIATLPAVVPQGLVADSAGNLYGARYQAQYLIFRCTPSGELTEVPGSLPRTTLGADGRLYGFSDLKPLAFDPATLTPTYFERLYPNSTSNPTFHQSTASTPVVANGAFYGLLTVASQFSRTSPWPDPTHPITKWYPYTFNVIYRLTADGVVTKLSSPPYDATPFDLSATANGGLIGVMWNTEPLAGTRIATISPTDGSMTPLVTLGYSSNGAAPNPLLAAAPDGGVFGTTREGGEFNRGTLFHLSSSGEFTELSNFPSDAGLGSPFQGLVAGGDGKFYGLANLGLFRFAPDGPIELFATFSGLGSNTGAPNLPVNVGDGFLLTTFGSDVGVTAAEAVVKILPDGTASKVATFDSLSNGSRPSGALVAGGDGYYYGVCRKGGANSNGTFFRVDSTGALTTLASFGLETLGAFPLGPLVRASDGNFYGLCTNATTGPQQPSENRAILFRVDVQGNITTLANLAGFGRRFTSPLALGPDGLIYASGEGSSHLASCIYKVTTDGSVTEAANFSASDEIKDLGSPLLLGPGTGFVAGAGGGPHSAGSIVYFDPTVTPSPTPQSTPSPGPSTTPTILKSAQVVIEELRLEKGRPYATITGRCKGGDGPQDIFVTLFTTDGRFINQRRVSVDRHWEIRIPLRGLAQNLFLSARPRHWRVGVPLIETEGMRKRIPSRLTAARLAE